MLALVELLALVECMSGCAALIDVSMQGKKPEFEPKRATGACASMAVLALADFAMIVWML